MEMISIEGLKRRIKEKFCNSCSTPYKDTDVIEMGEYCCDMVSDTMAFVDELPTIEAEPVKHGRWMYGENDDGQDGIFCSECEHFVPWFYEYYDKSDDLINDNPKCPNCGCKQDLEGSDING